MVVGSAPARADSCTGVTPPEVGTDEGARFAICYDPGNRVSITATSAGFGVEASLRHVIRFADEPDLVWKIEHRIADAAYGGFADRFDGVVYRGRFMRHARDGHLVLPLGTPKKIFLPFDIGVEAELGTLAWRPEKPVASVGVIKTAALIDLARSPTFRRRLTIGPVARWDMLVTREKIEIERHVVAPFSTAQAGAHFESRDGITVADFRVEAGTAWHAGVGWLPELDAEARIERIFVAINDRPIALVLGTRYASSTDEVIASVGARVVILHRRDPRVSLSTAD